MLIPFFFFKVTKQEYTGETDVPMQQDADADMYNTKRDPIEISDTPSPSPAPSVITISSDSEPETEVAPKRWVLCFQFCQKQRQNRLKFVPF